MSDPRKRFICKARKHVVSDMARPFGYESECIFCMIESFENNQPIVNKTDFWELYDTSISTNL